MSSVGEIYRGLAVRLFSAGVSDAEVLAAFSTTRTEVACFSARILQGALSTEDSLLVACGLYLGHRFGFTAAHVDVLMRLLQKNWHTGHEDAVSALSDLKDPASIECLYQTATARFDYLDYDEAFALGVKCIWALGNIGTVEAAARLADLLGCGNPILVENAENQLRRLVQEAKSDEVVRVASKAIGDL